MCKTCFAELLKKAFFIFKKSAKSCFAERAGLHFSYIVKRVAQKQSREYLKFSTLLQLLLYMQSCRVAELLFGGVFDA